MNALTSFGWTAEVDQQWHAQETQNCLPARVVRVDRGLVTVVVADGERRLPVAGRLRKSGTVPTVGDWAVVAADTVTDLLPRRNSLVRRDTDGSAEAQLVAANVDIVIVAVPLTESVRVRKLERYLAFARSSNAEPLVVLTKSDLCVDLPAALDDARAVAEQAEVHAVSAVTGEGIDGLLPCLRTGSTVVVVGPSGAGKSTLANALGAEREQATGAIRDDGRGRHTTTAREMLRLGRGSVADRHPWTAGACRCGTPRRPSRRRSAT